MSRYTCLHVVAEVLQRLARLRGIDDGGRRGPWAPWLRRSDDLRVGWGVVIRTWPLERGRAPGANAVPEREVVPWLREAAERGFDDYAALGAIAPEVSRGAIELLADHGVRTTPHELSEIVATRLLVASAELGRCPQGPPELSAISAGIAAELAGAAKSLPAADFEALAAPRYETLWRERGAAVWAAWPPSGVGLGADARPPLLPVRSIGAGRGGWALGTDRSVYDRYGLHYQRKARTRRSRDEPDRRPLPADGTERVEEELARVCSPYGLVAAEHHGVVLAIAYGAERGDARTSRGALHTLRTSPDPLLPLVAGRPAEAVPDEGLVAAVRDLVDGWRRSEPARLLAVRHGDLDSHVDVIASALGRKVWMDLHRREREFLTPADRPSVARHLKVAMDQVVPEAVQGRALGAGEAGPPDPADRPRLPEARVGPTAAEADQLSRRENTMLRLMDDARASAAGAERLRHWGIAITSGDDELVRREYADFVAEQVVASAGALDAARFSTADELLDVLRQARGDQA